MPGPDSRRASATLRHVVLAAALLVHVALVYSVVRQPLQVSRAQPAERSLIWRLHHDSVHRGGPGVDFFSIYHAGVKLSRHESLYDGTESPQITPEYHGFRYLPVVAMTIGRAATWFSPRGAYLAWIVILELVLALCVHRLWREERRAGWAAVYAAALLLSSPYFLEVHMGQFTFVTMALVCLGAARLDTAKGTFSVGGSAAFSGAVLLKVYPLVAIPALILRKRGLLAAASTVVLVVALNAYYFAVHPAEARAFFDVNFGDTKTAGLDGGNHGLVYVFFQLARDAGASSVVAGFAKINAAWQLVALGVTAALVLWRRPTMLTGSLALVFAHMNAYKHVWEHHASGAVVCAAFLLLRLNQARAGWARWAALASLALLVLPTPFVMVDGLDPTVWDPTPRWPAYARYLLPMCKAVPVLALWVISLRLALRERESWCASLGEPR